ncbi:MAG: phage head morphogenesis protein [Oceanococcaceae bacterium]
MVLPAEYYGRLRGEARHNAFSIAGLASLDQMQGVLDSLHRSIESGGTFSDWSKAVARGEIPLNLPAHRLDNIFRTNTQTAYAQGIYRRQAEASSGSPFLMYDAINDSRTRPSHAALDGFIARYDDPIWATHRPPNGFRCRCTLISLTEKQAIRRGYTGDPPPNVRPDNGWDYDPSQGGVSEGVKRSIENRQGKCSTRQFSVAGYLDLHCAHAITRERLERMRNEMGDDDAKLRRALIEGQGERRYETAREALQQRGLLDGALPEPVAVAVRLWSGDRREPPPYKLIGESLRGMARGISPSPEFASVTGIIWGVQRALELLPEAKPAVLYRGVDLARMGPELRRQFMAVHGNEGRVLQYNSFTAASARYDLAKRQFAKGAAGWMVYILEPVGFRDIQRYTVLPGAEHLAPMFSQYRVVHVRPEAKEIVMESVQQTKPVSRDRQFSGSEDPRVVAVLKHAREMDEEMRRNPPPPLTKEERLLGEHMQWA